MLILLGWGRSRFT